MNLGDLEWNLLAVKGEKGEVTRILGLPEFLVRQLDYYRRLFRYSSDAYALFTTRISRIDYNYARNLVKKIALDAGVPKFHAHVARHWYATTLLKRSKIGRQLDIREIQIHLGHASLASTEVYTHLQGNEVAKHASERMTDFFRGGGMKPELGSNPWNFSSQKVIPGFDAIDFEFDQGSE